MATSHAHTRVCVHVLSSDQPTEILCASFAFPKYYNENNEFVADTVVPDDSGGDGCTNPVTLNAHTDPTCDLKCNNGFESEDTDTSLTCASDADIGDYSCRFPWES